MTEPMRKAVFLDRDDTLISGAGCITHPAQVKLMPGAGQSLSLLQKMGYLLVIVTNQPDVARGVIPERAIEEVHHHLKKLLADEGVYIDAIYCCPFHPEGTVEQFARESDLRKPAPGMLLKAAKDMDIDLTQSWIVGDSYRDVAAGHRAGCRTILLDTPGKTQVRDHNDPEPDKRAVNLREAVNILRMVEFQQKAQTARAVREQEPAHHEAAEIEMPKTPCVKETSEPAAAVSTPAPAPQIEPSQPDAVAETPPEEPARPAILSVPSVSVKPKDDQSRQTQAKPEPPQHTDDAATRQLLEEILHRVKSKNRYDQYAEFSVFMLLAWLVQALAAFSLVLSVWFLLDKNHNITAVQTMIGYAAALQLGVIALLLMHDRNK